MSVKQYRPKQAALPGIQSDSKPSRVRKEREIWEQARFVWWARETAKFLTPEDTRASALNWLHHIPNGAKMTIGMAKKMKLAGMTAGVPDLCLWHSGRYQNLQYPLLYIEFKTPGESQSPEQKKAFEHIHRVGYLGLIVYTWQQAARTTIDYLGLTSYHPVFER